MYYFRAKKNVGRGLRLTNLSNKIGELDAFYTNTKATDRTYNRIFTYAKRFSMILKTTLIEAFPCRALLKTPNRFLSLKYITHTYIFNEFKIVER